MLSSGNGGSNNIIVYGDTDTTPSSKSGLLFQGYHSGSRVLRATLDWSGQWINEIGATFNQSGADSDFRVESDTDANALFVDAGNNNVILGGNAIGTSGTFGYNLSSDDIRHLRPAATAGDTIICAVYGVSNGLQITDDTSNNRVYKFHNAGAQSFFLGMTEAAFNESGNDRDFRVESDNNSNMIFVNAAEDVVGIGSSITGAGRFNVTQGRPIGDGTGYGTIIDNISADFRGTADASSSFISIGANRYANYGGTDAGIIFIPSTSNVGYFPKMLQTCFRGNNATSEGRMRWYKVGQSSTSEVALYEMNGSALIPMIDDTYDLGASGTRWDDVYATNGTINTSDASLKEQVTDLSAAELQAATACKALIKKYKWISSVSEKGEDARWHIGVIAQDIQQAFIDAGLNADDYGLFIRERWWTFVSDGREESTTRIEEIHVPIEEATEHTRLGVRYNELLAFIIAAL